MADHFSAGNSAFVDEDFDAALKHYNAAVAAAPDNADYLLKRSACHAKLDNLTEAVADANTAVRLAPSSAPAYVRKGMALFALEEFESARDAFDQAQKLDPSNAQARTWLRKCAAELSAESSSAPVAAAMQTSAPAAAAPAAAAASAPAPAAAASAPAPAAAATAPAPAATAASSASSASSAPAPAEAPSVAPSGPRIRYEWCQSMNFVDVDLFIKKPMYEQDKAKIDITANDLSVSVPLLSGNEYVLDVELCAPVVPEKCSVKYMNSKIEIKLAKAELAKWNSLERKETSITTSAWADTSAANKHVYPSSGKKKLDWAALEKEIPEEKPEGEAALNKVFQDIFANGSDEQKKAMMKSFTESGGTVLSTNWDEVGAKKVEGSAPPGLEMKSWSDMQK